MWLGRVPHPRNGSRSLMHEVSIMFQVPEGNVPLQLDPRRSILVELMSPSGGTIKERPIIQPIELIKERVSVIENATPYSPISQGSNVS